MRIRALSFAALAAAFVFTAAAPAQLVNDGFSVGPCCTVPQPSFPNFPAVQSTGRGACYRDCNLELQWNTGTSIQPTQILCDYWLMNINIALPTCTASGTLIAKYARTWIEFAGPQPLQVWRFLVNGDLNYTLPPAATTIPGCPVPLSAYPPYNMAVMMYGHVDYAFNLATNQWQIAYSLTHFCPTEMHAGFSSRFIPAAAGWAKRTYHFVAPANFIFADVAPPSGPIFAESVRSSEMVLGFPYQCRNEWQVHQGNLTDVFNDCSCADPTPIPVIPRYHHQDINGVAQCQGVASPFSAVPIPGVLPTGLRALSIGFWIPTTANTYPGQETLCVYLGVMSYTDLCPSTVPIPIVPANIHIVTGVGTTGGFPATLFDSPAPGVNVNEFLDLENMYLLDPTGFVFGFGSPFASDIVWNLNTL